MLKDINELITNFSSKQKEYCALYDVDEIIIAPWDTFSVIKTNEENFIIYGVKNSRVKLLFGEFYVSK